MYTPPPALATRSHSACSQPWHADGDWHGLGEDGGIDMPGGPGMSEESAPLGTAIPWPGGLRRWCQTGSRVPGDVADHHRQCHR